MKQLKHLPAVLLAMLVIAFAPGCANLEQSAYRTIGTTTATVKAAKGGWVDYVTQERLVRVGDSRYDLEKQVEQVGKAYAQYQAAMRILRAAVIEYKTKPETQPALETALKAVENASADLVALIRSFTTK